MDYCGLYVRTDYTHTHRDIDDDTILYWCLAMLGATCNALSDNTYINTLIRGCCDINKNCYILQNYYNKRH